MADTSSSDRAGWAVLLLVCGVQLLDVIDSSILNIALPSIRRDLGFSQQSLQWVISGYLVSYGGFLLLGGRLSDLLGRRRLMMIGTAIFAVCSLAGGLAPNATILVTARVCQGVGAALMAPAALSILTTQFAEGKERNRALGIWGAVSGLGAAMGVFFGGVISEGPGWRWVLLVNVPVCVAIVTGAQRFISRDAGRRRGRSFDVSGAVLVTAAALIGLYALIKAPEVGWATQHTIGELGTSLVLLAAFVANERRVKDPLFPFSIFRVPGILAADLIQLAAFGGFVGLFFFLTLYMQGVLRFSPIQAGSAYLPVTVVLGISAGISSTLISRVGTRPIIVAGALTGAAGMFYLAQIPTQGSYLSDVLPGLLVMAVGIGAILVSVTAAANAGVPSDKAGIAASLLSTSQQLGTAFAVAVFSALASNRTQDLLAAGASQAHALTAGYGRAILAGAIFVTAAAVLGLRVPNTRTVSQAPGIPSLTDPEPVAP